MSTARPRTTARSGTAARAAAADVAAVVVFVLIGRSSHDEGFTLPGTLATAWPFIAGLALGWALARAWRKPTSLRTGTWVWLATVIAGIVLRAASGQGVQVSFVIVTTIVLAAFLICWRVIVRVAGRRGRARPAPSGSRTP